jgi:predicted nucleic acid-binding protein
VTSDANALVDTGFLVALADHRDRHHSWAAAQSKRIAGPWLTCEACITELDHLLGFLTPPRSHQLYEMLGQGLLQSHHLLPEQLARVHAEIARYKDRRVDFSDACLVILGDQHPRLPIVTTDAADFAIYLRSRPARPLLTPPR